MVYRQIVFFFLIGLSVKCHGQATYPLDSPSGNIHLQVKVADSVYFAVRSGNIEILSQSVIALLSRTSKLGIQSKVRNIKRRLVRETIVNPVPFKRKEIPDHFNELTLTFREDFSIIFRVYDDGVAYRFVTKVKDSLEIIDEIATFRFSRPDTVCDYEMRKEKVDPSKKMTIAMAPGGGFVVKLIKDNGGKL